MIKITRIITVFSAVTLLLTLFSCTAKPAERRKSEASVQSSSSMIKQTQTLGQLLIKAVKKPGAYICITGKIGVISRDDRYCYYRIDEPKNFCVGTFRETNVAESLGAPFWVEKGLCETGINGTSGSELVPGDEVVLVSTVDGYLLNVDADGTELEVNVHSPYSPIFDVRYDGRVVVGGEGASVRMAETVTITIEEFWKVAKNISAGTMLRYTDHCSDDYCEKLCVSSLSAAAGIDGLGCGGTEDCYYSVKCAVVVSEEPDVCSDCGEAAREQQESSIGR